MLRTCFAIVLALAATPGLSQDRACTSTSGTQAYDRETICVSSFLAPQSGNHYDVRSLRDDDIRTAWCEGVKGTGAGQSITIEWRNAGPLHSLWVSNGYAKSSNSFRKNGRVKDVTVAMWRAGSGDADYTVFQHRLADHGVEQVIDLPFPQYPLRKLLIRIDSTYAGAKWQDTCINELWTDFGM